MALPFAITLALLIMYISFFIQKKLSFLHNAIVFMVMVIVARNYITIMTMELEMLKATKDSFLHIYLLIDREIIFPLIIIIYLNLHHHVKGKMSKGFLFLAVLVVIQSLDALQNFFEVIEFVSWNWFYVLLVNAGYMIIGIGISKTLLIISERKGHKYDSYL